MRSPVLHILNLFQTKYVSYPFSNRQPKYWILIKIRKLVRNGILPSVLILSYQSIWSGKDKNKKIYILQIAFLPTRHLRVHMNSFKRVRAFQIELEFGSVGFWGEGKTGVPGEKPLGARERTNNKLNPHMASTSGFEPGPHCWEASALTTAPPLLPDRLYRSFVENQNGQ